ncbi:MAG: hypothetical protein KJ697_05030 [Nanoarchaeota archaeon]|nr:hypothetical protein [Nanoarchaeota archaeon]
MKAKEVKLTIMLVLSAVLGAIASSFIDIIPNNLDFTTRLYSVIIVSIAMIIFLSICIIVFIKLFKLGDE